MSDVDRHRSIGEEFFEEEQYTHHTETIRGVTFAKAGTDPFVVLSLGLARDDSIRRDWTFFGAALSDWLWSKWSGARLSSERQLSFFDHLKPTIPQLELECLLTPKPVNRMLSDSSTAILPGGETPGPTRILNQRAEFDSLHR